MTTAKQRIIAAAIKSGDESLAQLQKSEREEAIILANYILDKPNADPDDNKALLARQLLRQHDNLKRLWHFAGCPYDHCQTCIDDAELIRSLEKWLGPPSAQSVQAQREG